MLATWIGFRIGVISVTDAHNYHSARAKAACCRSFKGEVGLRKSQKPGTKECHENNGLCSYLYKGLTTTMCVVRSPRPTLACPKV